MAESLENRERVKIEHNISGDCTGKFTSAQHPFLRANLLQTFNDLLYGRSRVQ